MSDHVAVLDELAPFDLGDVVGEPALVARGAQGLIWRVRTARGVYAVKRLQPWVAFPPVPFDVGVQLAALAAGVPLPAPVLAPDGRAVVGRIRVYEWVELGPALEGPVTSERAAEVGDLLGRIHRLGVPPEGETGEWFLVPPTEAQWRQVLDTDVASPWVELVTRELPHLLEISRRFTVTSTRPTITCHADLNPTNLLPAAADGRLVVLDWENAGPLPADAELAGALLDWTAGRDGEVDVEAARALLAAYGDDAVPITEASFAVWVVTAVNFLRVLLDQLVSDVDGGDPAFAEDRLPSVGPARVRAAVRAIDVLVDACGR